MIKIISGDLFQTNSNAITIPVNTVGVMGKGLALEFKKRHMMAFIDYVKRCKGKEINKLEEYKKIKPFKIGEPYLIYLGMMPNRNYKYALIFPTKKHFKYKSKIDYLINGLDYLIKHKKILKEIDSLAIPMLGAGLGGLDGKLVIKTIIDRVKKLKIDIDFYVPEDLISYAKNLATRANKKG